MTKHINPWEASTLAQEYDSWFETPAGSLTDELEIRLLMRMATPRTGESALDVGTGTGHLAMLLNGKGLSVNAIDASPAMIKVASEKTDAIAWKLGQAQDLPYADNQFDLVTCVTALEFMHHPADAIKEMIRVLKPGGRLVLGVLNSQNEWAISRNEETLKTDTPFAHARYYQISELLAMLPDASSIRWNSSVFYGPEGTSRLCGFILEFIGQTFHKHNGALLVTRWVKP